MRPSSSKSYNKRFVLKCAETARPEASEWGESFVQMWVMPGGPKMNYQSVVRQIGFAGYSEIYGNRSTNQRPGNSIGSYTRDVKSQRYERFCRKHAAETSKA